MDFIAFIHNLETFFRNLIKTKSRINNLEIRYISGSVINAIIYCDSMISSRIIVFIGSSC